MNDTEKIIVLEQQLKYVLERMEKKDLEIAAFHEEFDTTKKKINNAEAWGRGVIWAVLGIGAFMSQWGTLIAFVKKHV